MMLSLSKSRFIAGLQCPKRLYLEVHQPDLAAGCDEGGQAVMDQGHEVGLVAQKRFTGGISVGFGDGGFAQAIRDTKELLSNPTVPAIFEAAFEHNGVFLRTDILERVDSSKFRLIEVKSSTSVKDQHLYDVAVQRHVLISSEVQVTSASLMHLNRDYVYAGGDYDLNALFKLVSFTGEMAIAPAEIADRLAKDFTMIGADATPDIEPGDQCNKPFTCEFFDHCNLPLAADHIAHLPGMRSKMRAALAELGVTLIGAIPNDFKLTDQQHHACRSVKTGKTWIAPELANELASLKYPLCFMDFETIFPALPRFMGMRPYDQSPIQWSVHKQESPGAQIEHCEFLAEDVSDPRLKFAESLCSALKGAGSIVVYNQTFEKQRLSELSSHLPKYRKEIDCIRDKLWDLLPMVRAHVYHPAFEGSYSLKKVLPALVPSMKYDGMEVADGGQAGLAWQKMISPETPVLERQQLRRALLDYCGQDTLALARLVACLRTFGSPENDCLSAGDMHFVS
jgi:predicted RecB family nuclease